MTAPDKGTSHCSGTGHQSAVGKRLLGATLHLQCSKINAFFLVTWHCPAVASPAPRCPPGPQARATGLATHVRLQAGTWPAAPGSHPHETFTARRRQGNSRLHPLPSLGKRDVSSLLGAQREDEDPSEVVLGAALPSTCHLGLVRGQARTVRWGGSAPLSRAAFWSHVSLPAATTNFAGQKGKGRGGLRTSCLLPQEYLDTLVGPLCLPSVRANADADQYPRLDSVAALCGIRRC